LHNAVKGPGHLIVVGNIEQSVLGEKLLNNVEAASLIACRFFAGSQDEQSPHRFTERDSERFKQRFTAWGEPADLQPGVIETAKYQSRRID
jgi:hypothetical protein